GTGRARPARSCRAQPCPWRRGRTGADFLCAGRRRRRIGAAGRRSASWSPWVGWGLSPHVLGREVAASRSLLPHLGQAFTHPNEAMISIYPLQPTGPLRASGKNELFGTRAATW